MLSAVGSLSDTSRITISMQTNALSRPSYNRGASVASSLYKLRADSTDRFLYTLQDMMHTKQTEALLNNRYVLMCGVRVVVALLPLTLQVVEPDA